MAWVGLLGTLGWNYALHRRHQHCPEGCELWRHRTICTIARRLPWPVLAGALSSGFVSLLVHLFRGYPRPSKEII